MQVFSRSPYKTDFFEGCGGVLHVEVVRRVLANVKCKKMESVIGCVSLCFFNFTVVVPNAN